VAASAGVDLALAARRMTRNTDGRLPPHVVPEAERGKAAPMQEDAARGSRGGRLPAPLRSWRARGPLVSSGVRTHMSIAVTFVVGMLLTACCLWAVTKWSGVAVPVVDLLIIAGLCSGLALLPSVGWVLATMIMTLLITRATDADGWPDTVLMLVGSNIVWLLVKVMLLGRV
jgi:hypothetical protein